MSTMTVSDFRNNMAAAFNRAAEGEDVKIKRGSLIFSIVLDGNEKKISPELQAKLDKAREEYRKGNCISLNSHEDIDKYFESL